MTWPPLLLADPSPCLRWLVLRDIFHRGTDDAEMKELAPLRESDPLVTDLLALQDKDGSWRPDAGSAGAAGKNRLKTTGLALTRLGYLGFDRRNRAVARGARYLFDQQQKDGSWALGKYSFVDIGDDLAPQESYSMVPLQTAFPLRGLAACGYATDPRAERAFEWLLSQRLPDGAWPTGIAGGGVYGGVGGYRRLAHSRWGCRSNTTAALICLALHPQRSTGAEARRALDLLLGCEMREAGSVGYEVSRILGAEVPRGFLTYFARLDLALILHLCSRVGASREDPRIDDLLKFVLSLQGEYGLWGYPQRPQVSRWLSYDLMRSISLLDKNVDWIGMEPRTPFTPYPKRPKRF
jgi:hypothetical protein